MGGGGRYFDSVAFQQNQYSILNILRNGSRNPVALPMRTALIDFPQSFDFVAHGTHDQREFVFFSFFSCSHFLPFRRIREPSSNNKKNKRREKDEEVKWFNFLWSSNDPVLSTTTTKYPARRQNLGCALVFSLTRKMSGFITRFTSSKWTRRERSC